MKRSGAWSPGRRSEAIPERAWDPVPWENDLPYRILSMDGGGIRGIFPAAVLAYLEREYLQGKSIGDYFDLIAGTSTGGILALGLGAGLTGGELLQMYLEEGHRISPSRRRGLWGSVKRLVSSQYDRNPLDQLLTQQLGAKTLRGSKYRLLIPSTEARNGEVYVFKTPHHPGYTLDGDERMSAVAAATSAAPTYFTPFQQGGYTYLDGGIWTNNPTMTALVEALYARVSSDRQDVDLSVSAQLRVLRDYADKNDYDIVREHVDEAESGRVMNRPDFHKMIEEAKKTEAPFKESLVWKFSRFTRKREHAVILKSLLRRKGLRVVSITEQADDNPTGRLLEGIIETVDEFYSENLALDVLRGMREAASRGFWVAPMAPTATGRSRCRTDPRRGPPWNRTPKRPASSSASSTWPRLERG